MEKQILKIAFIINSFTYVFPDGILRGGGNLVARHLIEEFAKKRDIELYIITDNLKQMNIPNVKKIIYVDTKENYLEYIKTNLLNKDYTLFLNIEAPFANVLLQAHTQEYRYTNGKNQIIKYLWKNFKNILMKKNHSKFSAENNDFFVVSNHLKEDIIQNIGISENNVTVAYPGVEIKESVVKKHNNYFTFGMVYGTSLNKGIIDVLFSTLLLKILGYKFKINMILSTPRKSKYIKFLIKILGLNSHINQWEKQKDMTSFYSCCDCVLMPSLNETFGLVTLEGASFNTPSIISSTSGASEIFTNDVNSMIYDKEHFPIWHLFLTMRKMLKLNKFQYTEMCNSAFELAQQYTWERFANKIYDRIVENYTKHSNNIS